jgi:cytochrome P450/NADPH-cytochrome P450 reductase
MLLQNFDISLVDPNYRLSIQQSLTIKPKDCYVYAKLRPGITAVGLQDRLSGSATAKNSQADQSTIDTSASSDGSSTPLTILFGSNTGTCQALAQKLVSEATRHGFSAKVKDMDTAIERLPTDEPVVIITASYEGQPPDNAARMFAWLESLGNSKDGEADTLLKGVQYAVFGCGHRDWVSTYQRVPAVVDELLEKHGATRLAERGASDVSKQDTFGDFDTWMTTKLFPALPKPASLSSVDGLVEAVQALDLEVSTTQRASVLQQRAEWAKVTETRLLTAPGQPEKRHIEFELPTDMTYHAGDYLSVLPLNPEESVRRVVDRFGLPWDGVITIKKGIATTLPVDQPVSLFELLRGYVELAQPATRKVSLSMEKDIFTTEELTISRISIS